MIVEYGFIEKTQKIGRVGTLEENKILSRTSEFVSVLSLIFISLRGVVIFVSAVNYADFHRAGQGEISSRPVLRVYRGTIFKKD